MTENIPAPWALVDSLKEEREYCLREIEKNWSDPDLRLARNRYKIHDDLIAKIRRIDGELAKFD